MDRRQVLPAVALVLAVVALGTIAGGLESDGATSGETSPGVGLGSGEGSGMGEGTGMGINTSSSPVPGFPEWAVVVPLLAIVWGGSIATLIYAVQYLRQTSLRQLVRDAARSLVVVVAMAVAVGVLLLAMLFFAGLFSSGGGGAIGDTSTAPAQLPGQSQSMSPEMWTGVLLLVGGSLLALLLVAYLSWDDDDKPGSSVVERDSKDDDGSDVRPSHEARVDVSDPAAANDVYRAWRGLRDRVGDRTRAESPAEVERRALEAGLDERAVGELTTLFNAVRYGDDGATNDRERRARRLAAEIDGVDGGDGSESGTFN